MVIIACEKVERESLCLRQAWNERGFVASMSERGDRKRGEGHGERGRDDYKEVGWDGQPRRRGGQGIAMRVDVIARALGNFPI